MKETSKTVQRPALGNSSGAVESPQPTMLNNRYQLMERLGEGGMGVVYKALDHDVVNGKRYGPVHVALKIIKSDKQGGPEAVEALKHEGIKATSLRHKNIVETYSVESDGDTWFLTMELLEGETFESVIKRYPGGVPQIDALPLISQLCAGVSYAHTEKKIIHSDLKPSNLFVSRDRIVKILDFGIASRIRAIGDPETRFEPRHWGALSPMYACMEMWSGVSASERDDVYSIGSIVYELLSGKHAFDGANAVTVYERRLAVQPIAALSRSQNAALKHALELHREARTPSVDEFLKEFTSSYKNRTRLIALSAAAVLSVLLVIYWITTLRDRSAPAALPTASSVTQDQIPGASPRPANTEGEKMEAIESQAAVSELMRRIDARQREIRERVTDSRSLVDRLTDRANMARNDSDREASKRQLPEAQLAADAAQATKSISDDKLLSVEALAELRGRQAVGEAALRDGQFIAAAQAFHDARSSAEQLLAATANLPAAVAAQQSYSSLLRTATALIESNGGKPHDVLLDSSVTADQAVKALTDGDSSSAKKQFATAASATKASVKNFLEQLISEYRAIAQKKMAAKDLEIASAAIAKAKALQELEGTFN